MAFNGINSYNNSDFYKKLNALGIKNNEQINRILEKASGNMAELEQMVQNMDVEETTLTEEEFLQKFKEYKEQNNFYMQQLSTCITNLNNQSRVRNRDKNKEENKTPQMAESSGGEETDNKKSQRLTNSAEIRNYISSLPQHTQRSIKEQLNNLSSINCIEISENGQIRIKSDEMELMANQSGFCTVVTGEEVQEEPVEQPEEIKEEQEEEVEVKENENEVEAEEPAENETKAEENTEEENSNSEQQEGEDSTEAKGNSNNQQNNTQGANQQSTDNGNSIIGNVFGALTDSSPISLNGSGGLFDTLNKLVQQKEQVKGEIQQGVTELKSTEAEKDSKLSAMDGKIATEEGNLSNAQGEVTDAQGQVDTATAEVQDATTKVEESKSESDTKKGELDTATEEVDTATAEKDTAEVNNQTKIEEEKQAQQDSDSANNDATVAAKETQKAQNTSNEKQDKLETASAESKQAYSVLNQKNAEVSSAQSEYNNAKAKQNSGIKNAWNKFKSWVSSAWTKLEAAIKRRDAAELEAEKKAKKEKEAQVASDKALEQLTARKEEQATAEDVAAAAQVVLEKKTGEREVSDQEYADALATLATAMDTRKSAEDEYNSALETLMEMEGWKADADGNLVDAEGKLVSAEQVAAELETYVVSLSKERKQEETSYNNVLNNIAGTIEEDEQKMQALDAEIVKVEQEIQEEQKLLEMQEMMMASVSQEKSEYYADEETDGIGDDIVEAFGGGSKKDAKEIESKEAALEQALLSGSKEDILAAYKAIYGDKEIIIDSNNNIVDPETLSEEELSKYSVKKVSDLSADSNILAQQMDAEASKAVEARQVTEAVQNGVFTFDGKTLTTEDLTNALLTQQDYLQQDVTNARNQQGWLSKSISGVNSQLGIGTTSLNAEAQVAMNRELIEELNNCDDPSEYAAKFKSITGQDLNMETVAMLLSSEQLSKPTNEQKAKTPTTEDPTKIDLSEVVNDITTSAKEEGVKDGRALSLLDDTKAAETIEDYKETQETAKEAVTGVISGVVATVSVAAGTAAGVCAAPFTGGASLGLVAAGFGIAGSAGAVTNLVLNGTDSIYDADNNGDYDFNYTWKDAGKDAFTGALNGVVGNLTNAAGLKLAGSIGSNTTKTMVATTGKEVFKKTALNVTSKMAGNALEGGLDGALSSSAEYLYTVATDANKDFDIKEFAQQTGEAALFGSVFNVGLGGATDLAGAGFGKVKNIKLTKEINEIFADGVSDSKLANTLADSILLDPNAGKFINADDTINKYAVDQLRKNADTSVSTLKSAYQKAGIEPDNAYNAIKGVPLDKMGDYSKVFSVATSKNSADILNGANIEEGITNLTKNIDDIQINSKTGNLESFTVKGENGSAPTTFEFNENGLLTSKSTIDGDTTKFEYDSKGNKISADTTAPDGTTTKTDYEYNNKGNVSSETTTNADGTTTKTDYEYNRNGKVARETTTNSDGSTTVTDNKYDAKGNKTSSTQYEYDAKGHKTSSTQNEYDAKGHKTSSTQYEYDADNTITTKTTTKSNYDNNGNVYSETSTKLEYNNNGKVSTETITSGKYTTRTDYKYDSNGILSEQTTTSGNKTYNFEFDQEGKIKSATIKSGDVVESLNFEGIENVPALLDKFRIADSANSGNGWTTGEVFYKELSDILSKDSTGSIHAELNKYLNGEYSEIFNNPDITMQPKDLVNLITNEEYGTNLSAIYKGLDGTEPIKLTFGDDVNVELNTNNLKQLLSAKDGQKMNIANLATQQQFADNLKKLTNADGTYTEVYDALCKLDYWDANKFLTLGDFEFESFNELAKYCDLNGKNGLDFRTITDTTNVTSRFELAKQIATDKEFGFTAKKKMPIEYACILANSGCNIDQIETAYKTLTKFDSKFKLDSPRNAATLRLFAGISDFDKLNNLDDLIATKQAIMDCEYYLKEMSGDAQISQKYIKLFNQKIGISDYRLELDSTFKEINAKIEAYESIKYKSSNELLADLNITNINDDLATQLDNAFKNKNSEEISAVITKIMASSNVTDNKATREMLITGLRKSGLDEVQIQTTMADYDLLVDIKHVDGISNSNNISKALGDKEITRLKQDMAIIIALEYPSGSTESLNIENKIADMLEDAGIDTNNKAYNVFNEEFISQLDGDINRITESQKHLPQSKLGESKPYTENGMTYNVIDGKDFQGYVYSVGALSGGKPMSAHDQRLNFYKILDRAGGRYENEVCSSSYIDANIGETNVYQNMGVIFDANDNSLICALPYDASTHMGARREQLANYYFESKTMDISAQGMVYNYRNYTADMFDIDGNLKSNASIDNGAILSGNKGVLYNKSAANEALLFNPSIKALYFKGAQKDIPKVLKQIASERGLPIVLIP